MHTKTVSHFTRRRGSVVHAGVLALSAALVTPAEAQNYSWNTGFNFWEIGANWTPAGPPPSNGIALIGNLPGVENETVYMSVNDTVGGLSVTDGMTLLLDGGSLNVTGNTLVSGSNTVGLEHFDSWIRIYGWTATELYSDNLTVSDGGRVTLYEDATVFVYDTLRLDTSDHTPIFDGQGGVTLRGTGTTLVNDGRIRPFGGTLSFTQFEDGRYDLDGQSGDGEIYSVFPHAHLIQFFGAGLADSFSGTIQLSGGAELGMFLDEGWATDQNGAINVDVLNPADGPAIIDGSTLNLGGLVDVNGNEAYLHIQPQTVIQPTAQVQIGPGDRIDFGSAADSPATTIEGGDFTLADQAMLKFVGATIVRGGSFQTFGDQLADGSVDFIGETTWDGDVTIAGVARQLGDATVSGPTTINAEVFDLDGNGATWNINERLTVNTVAIDTAADPIQFNSTINLSSVLFARLTVNLAAPTYWHMGGQMTLAGPGIGFATRVAGSTMYVSGELDVLSGQAQIDSDLILGGTTTVPAGTTLRTNGYTQVYAGAEFAGSGTLRNAAEGTMSFYPGASLGEIAFLNTGRFHIGLLASTASVGRFEQTANGTWSMNITGQSPDTENDLLIVSDGPAVLAGELLVHHYDLYDAPFRGVAGDEFTILTSLDDVSGTFAANPRSFSQGQRFDWTVLYGSNDVKLRLDAVSACALGDLDDDGDVDLQDLALLLAHFGTASDATWSLGDLDGDGDVDLQDLANLLAHFGSNCG